MGTYESLFCSKMNAASVVVTCEVVGTLNHYKMVKKNFELCALRGSFRYITSLWQECMLKQCSQERQPGSCFFVAYPSNLSPVLYPQCSSSFKAPYGFCLLHILPKLTLPQMNAAITVR